ncbi:MAG: DeoR/GlpR family DNA-binding transcription regulator [Lentisphaeria bacterium]|nr:DeoR/GlpR family DNA-binding transcription regulator [Lentisphaeria bacterium]
MGRGFEKRKRIILDYLQDNPEIRVPELMELTGAAVATVRRDLLELERQKLIVRTFGGVRAMDQKSLVDRTFEQRANCQAAEKHRIAVAAAKLVKPGMTIAIDSGTTCMNLAAMLKNKAPLRIITAALAVIETLGGVPGIEINLVGGQFRVANLDFYGTVSINTFKQFHADIAFMSCDGLLPEFGAFSHDQESAAISQALIACASKRVLLCDSKKIGQSGAFLVFAPEQIDCLVTDRRSAELDERGYNCLVAGE